MATLNSALNHALSGLAVSTVQSNLVSRNIASAGDGNHTRKTAEILALPGGTVSISGFKRSTDRQVLDKLLLSNSELSGRKATLDAVSRLSAFTGNPDDEQSISAAIGQLQTALRGYEANPVSVALGRDALEAARSVVLKLNTLSTEALSVRESADSDMAQSAERLNNLLAQFKVVNDSIVRGDGTPDVLAESLDQRDGILKLISDEIGIRTSTRPNNDLLIYTESGAVLFEVNPRTVVFNQSPGLQPQALGHPLYIDGVAVTGEDAPMRITGGRLGALALVRDITVVQFTTQLDLIAAGLIRGFSESTTDNSLLLPEVEGLFQGTGTLPSALEPNPGLSSLISINSLADPEKGGSPSLIRDGGFGGSDYVYNTSSLAGYQARLAELSDVIDSKQSFPFSSGVGGSASVKELSLQSASWLGSLLQSEQSSFDVAATKQSRSSDALSRISGVNIDQEMASLLDLEKSYQASSKVLAVVNSMLSTLIEVIG